MQYVPIKEQNKSGIKFFIVNSITLKNKNKTVIQRIPHPMGTDTMEFKTLEEAKEAIIRAGFSYILPDGSKDEYIPKSTSKAAPTDYENVIFDAIKSKVNSSNPNVCQAAILAIAEFPSEETFDILFNKLGEENDLVRKNAISAICRYHKLLQDRIILTLSDANWVTRNSALSCIKNITQDGNVDVEGYIEPLIKSCEDSNPIVQANALSVLAQTYRSYKNLKSR